jgi:hypothetical protein
MYSIAPVDAILTYTRNYSQLPPKFNGITTSSIVRIVRNQIENGLQYLSPL